jgi:hypothetical protein
MIDLDATNIVRIAREVTLEQSLPLKVAGVVFAGGGGDYVEILINIDGCPCEPCQFTIGAFRGGSEVELRDEIGARLRQYLDGYRSVQMRRTA